MMSWHFQIGKYTERDETLYTVAEVYPGLGWTHTSLEAWEKEEEVRATLELIAKDVAEYDVIDLDKEFGE